NEPWAATGELHLEDFPLEVMSNIAAHLPLGANVLSRLEIAKPQGQVQDLNVQWFDAGSPGFHFKARGQVHKLHVASSAASTNRTHEQDWWPGLQNAWLEFESNELSGKAKLVVQDGQVSLVNWLEDPSVSVKEFSALVSWAQRQDRWQIKLQDAHVKNTDGQGRFELNWEQGNNALPLGRLDLQVQVERLQASRLHRYLPNDLAAPARRYLRDALTTGRFENATLQIQGPLDHFPFHKTKDGVFSVRAPFMQLGVQYAPVAAISGDSKAVTKNWPAVQQAQGELVINRHQLQVKASHARIGSVAAMQVTQLEVHIPDLNNIEAEVIAQTKGNLKDALLIINASPLAQTVGRWFNPAGVSGQADHQFRLFLPISNLDNSRVQG
ncbi:MAG: DUF3971 domain-containing protein, partial [Limnohabitans sp.]